MTDLLDELENMARTSFTSPGDIRMRVIDAVETILDASGTVDFGRVRKHLPDGYHGPTCGSTITGMVRRGELVWTGAMAPLGNTKQRAGGRLVKVYRRTV